MAFLSRIFNRTHTQSVKRFEPVVGQINALEESVKTLSDADLKAKTAGFKSRLLGVSVEEEKKILSEIVPEAFALVREASRRTLGQRHFDVQLIGGMVLNAGGIAEMKTGEGKTLVATLPTYLNALSGKGVHVVTVNDYLSRRDAAWMGQIYDALGLSVAVINHDSSFMYDGGHSSTPVAQGAGKVAGSVAIDTLDAERDSLGAFKVVHEFLRPVTRREAYAADITYGTNNEFGFDYLRDNLEYSADRLRQREPHYAIVDEIDSILIDEARTPLIISAPSRDAEGIYRQFASLVTLFNKEEDYTVDEKHRSISLTQAGITKAEKALNIENIYTDKGIKFVHHLETAIRAKAIYQKDVDYVLKDGQVVIVDTFTGRLQPGRRWSEGLHQAIEAKENVSVQQESRTYASITFQNFFRMYPKIAGMTGTASTSAEEFFKVYGLEVYTVPTNKLAVRKDLNDQIFRTEIGKFKALARTVKEVHAKGQPILIGTVSIEKNEVLSTFLKAEGVPHEVLNAKNHEREGEIVAQAGKKGAVTIATNMAGRGVDIKLGGNPSTVELSQQVKDLGGLFVIGTERHEARRIDNQLRGRAGRQGDPGATQFFVSLEDQLMRVFASDTMKTMMGKLGMPEDEAIEHRLISRSLETAQEKIEGFNFDSRKHVLEFDDVINHQRRAVYASRRRLLLGSLDDVESELQTILGATDSTVTEFVSKKITEFGREAFLSAVRIILLQTIDMFWVEHLEVMDHTRSSVNLRAYGQRDPLVEYKKEGLRLFREMNAAVREQVTRLIPHITPVANGAPIASNVTSEASQLKEVHENAQLIGSATDSSVPSSGSDSKPEVGRNDPCPCGSGKKYKKCHGVGK
jgi:preprotein translocase subunit SecA